MTSENDHIVRDDGCESADLYEHFRFDVARGQAILRIDKYLAGKLENTSRSRVQAAALAGNILVNQVPVKSNYRVKPGDTISIVLAYPRHEYEIIPENIPIDFLYQDEDLVVINKAAGMVVHPGLGNYSGTLIHALAYHLKDSPLFTPGDYRPGLVHRLDKMTSGVMVIAKNEISQAHLAKQFYERTIERRYIALVWGNLEKDEGTITGNIGRNPKDRTKMHVFDDDSQGKYAVTHYRVMERLGYVNLVECRLETGRTHQIRVHFRQIRHPVFGDTEYGGDKILRGTTHQHYKQFIHHCFQILPRQALHAVSLGFIHPRTGKNMLFETSLPADMNEVLEKWRNYIAGRTTV